jgi:hypothetical protein
MKAVLLFTAICYANPIVRADSAADRARVHELVLSLGSRDYRTREKATQDLSEMGRAAYAELRHGADDPDPEIRARCNRLLPHAYELEMKARIDAFVADTQGKHVHDLPGWERFRKLLGEDAIARDFFASMVRLDSRLMDAVERQSPSFGLERLLIRCTTLQQQMYPRFSAQGETPSQVEVGQILFLAVNPRLDITAQACASINQFLYRPEVRTWFASGNAAPLMRKLLLNWLDRHIDEPRTGTMIANLMNSLQLKELTDLGLKLLLDKKTLGYVRAQIMVAFGKMGQKDVVEKIQPLLTDDTQVAQFVINQTRSTTQIGDIALAISIHLSGQSVSDYGFDGLKNGGASFFSYYRMGFTSDEHRAAARKKWQEWRDQQKK